MKAIICPLPGNIYASTDKKVRKLIGEADAVVFEFTDTRFKNHVLMVVDDQQTAQKIKSLFLGRLRDLGPDSKPSEWGKIGFEIMHTDISIISQKLQNAGIEVTVKSSSHLKLVK